MDQLKALWAKNKFLFFIILPILIIIKFRNVLIDLLISNSKQIDSSAIQKDKILADQATAANKAADALLQESSDLSSQEKPVDENWYKGN